MSDYPDWVLKFKKKGTYINVVKDKYYLYAAHSERVPGTKKVKRVCDGYLGRITEEDGLIPPRDIVKEAIKVYEYALSSTILSVCSNIHKGLKKSFLEQGDFIMCASILSFIYGRYSAEVFEHSYLSIRYSSIDFNAPISEECLSGIERGTRMIADTMQRKFGEDLDDVCSYFCFVKKVKINSKFYLSEIPILVVLLKDKYKIQWKE